MATFIARSHTVTSCTVFSLAAMGPPIRPTRNTKCAPPHAEAPPNGAMVHPAHTHLSLSTADTRRRLPFVPTSGEDLSDLIPEVHAALGLSARTAAAFAYRARRGLAAVVVDDSAALSRWVRILAKLPQRSIEHHRLVPGREASTNSSAQSSAAHTRMR